MNEINKLLTYTMEQNASDLHLATNQRPFIRVDGDLQPLTSPPLNNKKINCILSEIMNESTLNNYQKNLEVDFSYRINQVSRFRVNAYFDANGPAIAFRPIPEKIPDFSTIGLNETFDILCRQDHGIILVTGPTGCGKSTTLAAMINHINEKNASHILTIEDPIEFIYKSKRCLINQREVHHHTRSFHAALRSALREDPDIILIGEMRDTETISLALTAAETGHLVLATLHTNSAAKTIHRIIDAFPTDKKSKACSMLSESLRAIVAQRLFKKVGGGRVATREIMINTPAISHLIRENKVEQIYSAIQTGKVYGMMTMEQHIEQLIASNIITTSSTDY